MKKQNSNQSVVRRPSSTVTHTPWPWSGHRNIVGTDQTVVCTVNRPSGGNDLVENANARLIATAPELLDALERLRDCPDLNLDELDPKTSEALHLAQMTILKAKGLA